MVEEHPHDGGLGNGHVDPVGDGDEFGALEHGWEEARPIVRIHPKKTLSEEMLVGSGGGDRKIPALRMTSDEDPRPRARRGLPEITGRRLLRGHRETEGHVEVLLPPDERAVGPAEGHVDEVVAEDVGRSGELHLRIGIDLVDAAALDEVAESGARAHREEEAFRPLRIPQG